MTPEQLQTTARRIASTAYATVVYKTEYGAYVVRADELWPDPDWWKDEQLLDAVLTELYSYDGVSDIEQGEEDGTWVFDINLFTDYYIGDNLAEE